MDKHFFKSESPKATFYYFKQEKDALEFACNNQVKVAQTSPYPEPIWRVVIGEQPK